MKMDDIVGLLTYDKFVSIKHYMHYANIAHVHLQEAVGS